MYKILIADDHAVVRKGLKQILTETSDMIAAGEASTGQEVLDMLMKNEYDVVILDISMPGRSGLDIMKDLKNMKSSIPVLVLSIHPEEQYAVRALKAGASGYLTKESAPDELVVAVRKVAQGGKYVTTSLAEKLAFDLGKANEKPLHETLSDREFQVMCMIGSGKPVKEIAEELCLSIKTISTYRSRILEKTKMKNNAEITRYAIKNGLVD
jgi:two-component system invasion response regulator UvrY